MIDIKLLRNDPDLVRENMKKKFQDEKLPLVDEVLALDKEYRATLTEAETLKSSRNSLSKEIGKLMGQGKKEEAEAMKKQVQANADRLTELDEETRRLAEEVRERMMVIPNIIDDSVPIGRDDSENVELERFGEPVVPDFEIPYHMDIIDAVDGASMETARKTSGSGFWLLKGNIARLHSAVMSYARDFMIDKGFTYCIPPYMIRAAVVEGVMSFTEMENMMYKIEG